MRRVSTVGKGSEPDYQMLRDSLNHPFRLILGPLDDSSRPEADLSTNPESTLSPGLGHDLPAILIDNDSGVSRLDLLNVVTGIFKDRLDGANVL